jgi:hypothetical protein
MNYLQNHIWCSDSNWGGQYDCRHLVSVDKYHLDSESREDWDNLVDEKAEIYFDQDECDRLTEMYINRGITPDKEWFEKSSPNLKPEVLQWLVDNVEDRPKSSGEDCLKGWCVGSTEYRHTDGGSITIFFHRRKDAMAFIKKWSKWKKPTHYCQYFTDVRKKLDLETMKYVTV